ncbi:MAG: HD domain-containing protein [Propionibacteriaceae bacterium]|nr:HD domain-containing protein [Propionibacteriaceae bacterium]
MQRAHTMVEATVQSIMKSPDALWQMTSVASHDYYTYTHCVNVCMFLVAACREVLNITNTSQLQQIGLGGLLHDVGKSSIPPEILNKPGKLDDEEFALIKTHPAEGHAIATSSGHASTTSLRIILQHHEQFSGGGYPAGLSSEGIHKVVRMSTIIDVYDALTTKRPYADARQPFKAMELMVTHMKSYFDSKMVRGVV